MSSTPSPAAMLKKLMEELSNQLGALQAGITSLTLSTVQRVGIPGGISKPLPREKGWDMVSPSLLRHYTDTM